MHAPKRTGWLFGVGVPLMVVALILVSIKLNSEDYAMHLIVALALTVLADGFFIAAFIRGGLIARFASVFMMLPTLFVLAEIVRQAPLLEVLSP
jgi:hypothetical protein